MVLLVRLGSQIPIPGIDTSFFKEWFAENANDALNMFSAFTGGSFENFSVFALGITPFITTSIIIQLLSVCFPKLEEMQKDGEYGRKKIEKLTRIFAIVLSLIESLAMTVGFGRSGLLPNMNVARGIVIVMCLCLGSAALIFIGDMITKHGVGNGISVVLVTNILARIPSDLSALFESFVKGKTIAKGTLAAAIILAIILCTTILTIYINEAVRNIPIQYSRTLGGNGVFGSSLKSYLPIKVSLANVIPVIFAASVFSIPQLVATLAGRGYGGGISAFILNCTSQSNWFSITHPEYSIGLILYIVMIFFFGFYYTSINFNSIEIADNLKKQGGVIPGIRPGKPTELYLNKTINKLVLIGTTGLCIIILIPTFFSGAFGANVSFGGTSLIIICSVVIETLNAVESEMQASNYETFLN